LARKLRDERGHVAELADAVEPPQRRDHVVREALRDHLEGEIPTGFAQSGSKARQSRLRRSHSVPHARSTQQRAEQTRLRLPFRRLNQPFDPADGRRGRWPALSRSPPRRRRLYRNRTEKGALMPVVSM